MAWGEHGPLAIARCCRDWPVWTLVKLGRCGYCKQVPTMTEKTVDEYMKERADG